MDTGEKTQTKIRAGATLLYRMGGRGAAKGQRDATVVRVTERCAYVEYDAINPAARRIARLPLADLERDGEVQIGPDKDFRPDDVGMYGPGTVLPGNGSGGWKNECWRTFSVKEG